MVEILNKESFSRAMTRVAVVSEEDGQQILLQIHSLFEFKANERIQVPDRMLKEAFDQVFSFL